MIFLQKGNLSRETLPGFTKCFYREKKMDREATGSKN